MFVVSDASRFFLTSINFVSGTVSRSKGPSYLGLMSAALPASRLQLNGISCRSSRMQKTIE